MNLILRTLPDLIVMSWIPSETPNKLRFPNLSSYLLTTTSNLKRVTLRFANYADMVETPLRPITNSGIWRSIMAPTYSTMIQWSIEPLSYETNSFCLTIYYLSEIRSSVSPYLVQSRYWQVLFTRSVVCDLLWSLSHACKLIRWHSTERAQSISIRHRDGQIPLLIHIPLLILSEYLIPSL